MGEIQIKEQADGKNNRSKKPIRIDMTPMVDLGFLLITFFMFTTNFSKLNVMDIAYPPKNPDHIEKDIDYRNSITFILGRDGRVFYYQEEKENLNTNSLKEASFDHSEIAKTIEFAKARAPKKENFTIIIKPADDSQYKTMVDMLDELAITRSERYGISELNDKEKNLYQKKIE